MKEIKWNTIIFLLCIMVYVLFTFVFWTIFAADNMFSPYFDLAFDILKKSCLVNIVCQSIAVLKKERHAFKFLLISTVGLFFVIIFTVGQSV